jgi:hypothetical protein
MTRRRGAGGEGSSCRNAEGVWFNTVTPSSSSNRQNAAGSRLTQYGTTTSRPPYSSAPQISHTEKSNAYEWNSVHTSSGPNPNQRSVAAQSRETLPWGITTPLGRPVEPEV